MLLFITKSFGHGLFRSWISLSIRWWVGLYQKYHPEISSKSLPVWSQACRWEGSHSKESAPFDPVNAFNFYCFRVPGDLRKLYKFPRGPVGLPTNQMAWVFPGKGKDGGRQVLPDLGQSHLCWAPNTYRTQACHPGSVHRRGWSLAS